jgi:CHAT domain-containing protein/Tfp pilus assembly protein PilF
MFIKRGVSRTGFVFALVGLTFTYGFTSRLSRPRLAATPLDSGSSIERALEPGEEHRYALSLPAGEWAQIVVEQHGLDALVQVSGPDGRTFAEFQDEIRSVGREQVEIVAEQAGAYTLLVKAVSRQGFYRIRLEARRPAADRDRVNQNLRTQRFTGARLEADGRFADAASVLEQALASADRTTPENPQVAAVTVQLARVYRQLPDPARSESLYNRALALMDRSPGAGDPATALVRSQLAELYHYTGDRLKAEALLREAMDIVERTLGDENTWFVSCLNTLGNLRESVGDLDEAEAIIRRALSISETIGDVESAQYAELLNNLGEVFRQRQDFTNAEAFLKRSVALTETLAGPETYSIAPALQNLGIVARERKDYPRAVAYNLRALSIRERTVGPDHPAVAHILTNLANVYRSTGDYERSQETHFRALRIWERAAGPYQPTTLLSVGNIAKTYAAQGDVADALIYQRRSDTIVEKQLTLNLAVGSERQKLAFAASVTGRTDRTISLHLVQAPRDVDAGALAALVVLQRKGRVLDAMSEALKPVRGRVAAAEDRALPEKLWHTTEQLARVALNPSDGAHAEERDQQIKDLEARKERLEAELSERSAEFRAQNQPVTLEAVQAAMPADAALLEFAIYRPFDPRAERNAEAYGPARYAVYVLRKHAAPQGFDLGAADDIHRTVDALRQALRDPARKDVQVHARAVYERIVRPLVSSIGDARRLLVSPDGELNLVPFEALVDGRSRYLIESYSIAYLTSGRDLLRMQVKRPVGRRPAIFADPLFGEPEAPLWVHADRTTGRTPAAPAASPPHMTPAAAMHFVPLAASAEEAQAIKRLFPDASLFTGRMAEKAALRRLESPVLLHIASHGFFLQNSADVENPLLRSGLALAGANLNADSSEGGILTALEAAGLNLWGTKLVTLSACDTGIGEVRDGEGVYGLRRAFVLAGAETVVMSLWQVSDHVALETMVAFYEGLRSGLGRGDALRQAKLALLRRHGREHPFYWASFIQSGEWTSLEGGRPTVPRELPLNADAPSLARR